MCDHSDDFNRYITSLLKNPYNRDSCNITQFRTPVWPTAQPAPAWRFIGSCLAFRLALFQIMRLNNVCAARFIANSAKRFHWLVIRSLGFMMRGCQEGDGPRSVEMPLCLKLDLRRSIETAGWWSECLIRWIEGPHVMPLGGLVVHWSSFPEVISLICSAF